MKEIIQKLHVQNLPDHSEELPPFVLGIGSLPSQPNQPVEVRIYKFSDSDEIVSEVPLVVPGASGYSIAECPLVFPVWLLQDGQEYANADDLIAGIQALVPPGVFADWASDDCTVKLTHPRTYIPPINFPISYEAPEEVLIPLVSSVGGDPVPCPIDFAEWTFPGRVTDGESSLLDQINSSGLLNEYQVASDVQCDDGDAFVVVLCFPDTGALPGNIQLDPVDSEVARIPVVFVETSAQVECADVAVACTGLYYPDDSETTFASDVAFAAAIVAATTATEVTVRCIDGKLWAEGDFDTETSIEVSARQSTSTYGYTGADQVIAAPPWARCATIKMWSGSSLEGEAGSTPAAKRGYAAYVAGKVDVADLSHVRIGRGGQASGTRFGAGSSGTRYERGGAPSGVYSPGGSIVLLAGNPKRELRALVGTGTLSNGVAYSVTHSLRNEINREVNTLWGDEQYSDGSLFGPISGTFVNPRDYGEDGVLTSAWIQIDFASPVRADQVFFGINDVAYWQQMRLAVSGGTASIADFNLSEAFLGKPSPGTALAVSYDSSTGAFGRPGGNQNHRGLIVASNSANTLTRLKFTGKQDDRDGIHLLIGEAVAVDGLAASSGYYGSPTLASAVSGGLSETETYNGDDPDYDAASTGQGSEHGFATILFSAAQC